MQVGAPQTAAPSHPEPPAYAPPNRLDPPSSSNPSPRTDFKYELTNKKAAAWAVLQIYGNAALSKHIPVIWGDEKIEGSVTLNLLSSDSIQALNISVSGRIMTGQGPGSTYTFLDLLIPLWSKSMGDPRNPETTTEGKYRGKLHGEYMWPFALSIPPEVILPAGPHNDPQVFRLPESFWERHTRASVQYDVTLHVTRGKLRPHNKLETLFGYVPIITPDSPSSLRRSAYQDNGPLLGPAADPEGWHSFPPIQIHGTISGKRSVEVTCTLSIAKPMSYTRGSFIPCALSIECQDLEALDILASPRAVVVRLRRSVKSNGSGVESINDGTHYKHDVEYTESGTWWPSMEGATDETYTRFLSGEIALKGDLKPTASIAHFRIEYSVVVFPFDATEFVSSEDSEFLLAEPVEIATTYASGPRPKSYAPPEYHRRPPPTGKYNTNLRGSIL